MTKQGYILIEYSTLDEANAAIKGANDEELLEQKVTVDFAFVRPPPAGKGRPRDHDSARVDVVPAGQGAGVPAATAQIWRIEQHKEHVGSCQYRPALQWKPSSTAWVECVACKAILERGFKMALESNLAYRLVFHRTGRVITFAL